VWSVLGLAFCYVYVYNFFQTWFHTFLVRGRGFSEANLLLSALPFVVAACANLAGGAASDALVRRLGAKRGRRVIGASALVLETHRPQERNKVQAFNDFLVFGMMALGSFSSGQLLAHYGWSMVNMVVFPPVLLGLAVLLLAFFAKRRAKLRTVEQITDPGI